MPDILAAAPDSLPEALHRAAADHPGRGIAVFAGRGRDVDRRTYPELWSLAQESAARVAALGIAEDEPVLIALPSSWDWLAAWFGVMVRGAWPVATAAAGAMAAAEAQFGKVEAVMAKIGARRVVASESFRQQAVAAGHDWAGSAVLTPDELAAASPQAGFRPPATQPDRVAFLQLTSGSTGLPRAVMITHRGAIHNPLASTEAIGAPHGAPAHAWADAMAAWLPLYHDMGLIGCLMLPILTGLDTWLLRPEAFLARPRLWLEQLGAHGTTFAPAPNFGYQLCVERVRPADMAGVDLSSWKAALTGAEMVRPETVDAFCEVFHATGFDPTAFVPCYGLAEGTLAVTFDQRGQGVRTLPAPAAADAAFALAEVVSTGTPIRDTRVRIAAANGDQLPEDAVGEVHIHGPGVFAGYHYDPEATADTLRDGWFATGDLGFLHDGELYLTGRTKDVLILHGHNLMPDELERLADAVTGGGGLMRTAAFSVARGAAGEQAVLVVEIEPRDAERMPALEQDIRSRIGRTLGIPVADLLFVRRGRIPRTTSGKMQRAEVRRRYLDGTLERLS